MAKFQLRLEAQKLRKQGKSLKAIARTLGVSKSSVGNWCTDIRLSVAQERALKKAQIVAGHRGRLMGAAINRQKRLNQILAYEQEGAKAVSLLSKRDKLILGVGLYWGEGVKARASSTAIINSDPAIVLYAKQWFQTCLGVSEDRFILYIYISEVHRKREKEILGFWLKLLKLPKEQFRPIIFIKGKRKKVYENSDSYYGVVALRVRRGTELKYRILGLIKACKESAGVAQSVRALHS